eukprot:COSAG02_NODE_10856_length_1845_cov_2.040092_1_plen_496_part_01
MQKSAANTVGRWAGAQTNDTQTQRGEAMPMWERSFEGHTGWVGSARYSPDGLQVVTASGDKTAKLWSVATGECVATLAAHTDSVFSAQYSPDGLQVVTASADKTAKLWPGAGSALQRALGLADQALTPGTRLRVGELGQGVYVRFERRRIGANKHYIRFTAPVRTEEVELRKLPAALWAVVEDDVEPEPEPGPESGPAAEEAEPPELDAWLAQADLAQYAVQVKKYGYHTLKVLQAATEADVVEMTEDPQVGMKKPHRRLFLETWKGLLATGTSSTGPGSAGTTAQDKFAAFFLRMGIAAAIQGLDATPVSSLRETVSFIVGEGTPSQDLLIAGCQRAEERAGELLAAGPDKHALTRDEIAAIHLYTQELMYRALNRALWSQNRGAVKPYWGFIRLLQHALFKVPKCEDGAIYRGIKDPYQPLTALMGKDVGDRSTWKTLLRSGQLDNQKIEIDVRTSPHLAAHKSPRLVPLCADLPCVRLHTGLPADIERSFCAG